MSRLSRRAALVATVGIALSVGCGGDKKTPDNPNGTGNFKPGNYHMSMTLSGTGSTSLCSAVPVQTTTLDTALCELGAFDFGIGLPDSCAEVTDKAIHVDCRAPLDFEGCTINLHFVGDGKIDSTDFNVTVIASIVDVAQTAACEPWQRFPCNFKFTITGQRIGNAVGNCTSEAFEGPSGILGVSWNELSPRAH